MMPAVHFIDSAINVLTNQPIQWFCLPLALVSALLMGFTRSCYAAGGFVVSPLMVLALGPKDGLAVVAPLMLFSGAFSCYQHRSGIKSQFIKSLVGSAIIGTIIGGFILYLIISNGSEKVVHKRIDIIVGIMSCIYVVLIIAKDHIKSIHLKILRKWKVCLAGIWVAISQTVTNSGSPVITVLFAFHHIKKEDFVGVQAWYLEIQNLLKFIPFVILGILHFGNFSTSIILLPLVILGNYIGMKAYQKMSDRIFFISFTILLIIGLIVSVILIIGRNWFFIDLLGTNEYAN